MPAHRNVDIASSRRSRRLSKQEPRNYAEDLWGNYELMYPSQALDDVGDHQLCASTELVSPLSVAECPTLASSSSSSDSRRTSHSRRKQKDHIARPPNAFMLFRSDFWAKEKRKEVPIERDHRDISRIAGHCWNNLGKEEKAQYQRLADERKHLHILENPGYKYAPSVRRERPTKRKTKKNDEGEEERCRKLASLVMDGVSHEDLREAMRGIQKKSRVISPHQPTSGPSRPRRTSHVTRHTGTRPPAQNIKVEKLESPPTSLPLFDNLETRSKEDIVQGDTISPRDEFSVKKEEEDFSVNLDNLIRHFGHDPLHPQFSLEPADIPYFAAESAFWYNYDDLNAIVRGESTHFPPMAGNDADYYGDFSNPLHYMGDPSGAATTLGIDLPWDPSNSCAILCSETAPLGSHDSDLNQYLHFDY